MTNVALDLAKVRRRVLIIQARRKLDHRDMEELAQSVLQDALGEAMTENTAKTALLESFRITGAIWQVKKIDELFEQLAKGDKVKA